MPKQLIRRYLPTPEKIKMLFGPGLIGRRLADPNLWHLNRRSASKSVFWGLLCALLPLPMQSILAAGGAILWRINLPLAVALTFFSNPLTLIPILLFGYFLGSSILNVPMLSIEEIKAVFFSFTEVLSADWGGVSDNVYFKSFWVLIFGLIVEAFLIASLGYVLTLGAWHWHIFSAIRRRKRVTDSRSI
ncbi:DUF2062 domain-containing protein [Thiofilum flexile]|uniref:DUF2062 domain-containing protein n=1 Tax=Thiofilum flexile TaxID=125627 RepID=UPI000378993F|nr:DUF2062 domain-containing protein [Thiofilum flexile]